MSVSMLLGIGLVFSGYTLEYLLAGSLGLFTLKFMGFIIYFCNWLDNNLILFLSGETGAAVSGASIWSMLSTLADDKTFSRLILDYTTAGMYVTLPALFGTVMVWAGIRGSEAIGEMQKAQQPLTQAGEKGAHHAEQIATQAGGMALGKAGKAILGKSKAKHRPSVPTYKGDSEAGGDYGGGD